MNLREAWLRTELFGQRLALVAGRLDLTNYFDHNAAANDETTQFLADALVNNPALGLASNGTGFAAVFDPKNGFNVKFGFQQSNPDATTCRIRSIRSRGGLRVDTPGWAKATTVSGIRGTTPSELRQQRPGGSVSIRRLTATLTLFGRTVTARRRVKVRRRSTSA